LDVFPKREDSLPKSQIASKQNPWAFIFNERNSLAVAGVKAGGPAFQLESDFRIDFQCATSIAAPIKGWEASKVETFDS
jgi:hypothetical protein